MCGNVKAPSLVGRTVILSKDARIGSFTFGSPRPGVTLKIVAEHQTTPEMRAEFERNTGEPAQDFVYDADLVSGASGTASSDELKALAGSILLFRDEFDLVD